MVHVKTKTVLRPRSRRGRSDPVFADNGPGRLADQDDVERTRFVPPGEGWITSTVLRHSEIPDNGSRLCPCR
jgi:hypothetical protein